MSDCTHSGIQTWGPAGNRLWACVECQRRFYPACPTCVDVGHRNIAHVLVRQPLHTDPEMDERCDGRCAADECVCPEGGWEAECERLRSAPRGYSA